MVVRPAKRSDISALLPLMQESGASFLGTGAPSVLRALCLEASGPRSPFTILVAEDDARLAGYVVSVRAAGDFRIRFVARHPLVVWAVARHYLQKRRRRASSQPPAESPAKPASPAAAYPKHPSRGWADLGADVAKIIHIGVAPEYRGRGVAGMLYQQLFSTLSSVGIRRVDATVAAKNSSSIRMHEKAGWTVHADRRSLFLTRDL